MEIPVDGVNLEGVERSGESGDLVIMSVLETGEPGDSERVPKTLVPLEAAPAR